MSLVKFVKGDTTSNSSTYTRQGTGNIEFDSTTKKIYLDGVDYTGEVEDELLENSNNPVSSSALYEVITENELTTAAALTEHEDAISDINTALDNKQDTLTFDSTPTANSTNPVTSGGIKTYIDTAINNLPEPMVFKGSLGTGGTITALPTNGSASVGDTYKVITAGTYANTPADEGDTFICLTKTSNSNTWELIPSGDEPSGTVTSVAMTVPTGLSVSGSPVTSSGTLAVSLASGYSIPTTTKQGNWDTAYTNNHTHSNKTVLDGISSTDITNWNAAANTAKLNQIGSSNMSLPLLVAPSGTGDGDVSQLTFTPGLSYNPSTDILSFTNSATGTIAFGTSNNAASIGATSYSGRATGTETLLAGATSSSDGATQIGFYDENNDEATTVHDALIGLADEKQDELVSGTNIKTINSTSLLGSGDISVQAPLTFDSTPTANSTNPVTSGGVYNALDKVKQITPATTDTELPLLLAGTNPALYPVGAEEDIQTTYAKLEPRLKVNASTATLYANIFNGTSFTGTAARATADANGDTITTTYAKLTDLVDEKVAQTKLNSTDSSTNIAYPLLLANNANPNGTAAGSNYSGITYNPRDNSGTLKITTNQTSSLTPPTKYTTISPTSIVFTEEGKPSVTGSITRTNYTGTAAQATADGSGNNIVNTYATKTELEDANPIVLIDHWTNDPNLAVDATGLADGVFWYDQYNNTLKVCQNNNWVSATPAIRKLYINVSANEIWRYNGTTMIRMTINPVSLVTT